MKKVKHIVLSLLLFTFAFILVHDYVVIDNHIEISVLMVDEKSNDTTCNLHESIHTLLLNNEETAKLSSFVLVYQKEQELQTFFISQIPRVLERPPSS